MTTATLQNVSRPNQPLQVGDSWQVTVTGPPNSPVTVVAMQNQVDLGQSNVGTTDANGNYALTGKADASTLGVWSELWFVGGMQTVPAPITFTVSAAPAAPAAPAVSTTASLSNTSRPGQPFQVGDSWLLTVTGAPNSPVTDSATQNGTSLGKTGYGSTDANGNFTLTGQLTAGTIGSWAETWAVGGVNAPTLSFSVSAAPTAPAPTPAPLPANTVVPNIAAGPAALNCFNPLAQLGIPDPCVGSFPVGIGTLAAGGLALFLLASMFGGKR